MGRKAKPVAASSSKALEVCGDTSRLGISAADVFAQFATPASFTSHEDENNSNTAAAVQDAEIALVLHAMQKKDPTTRLRGVAEMQQLFAARSAESLRDATAAFVNIYRKLWPQDAEPRVREGLQRCLQVLVEALQRDFARHFRSVFPTWLCAMYDTHPEVAQAARKALEASFEDKEKRRNAFRRCKSECLELLTANLQHSEQSLHDSLGIANNTSADRNVALERQDRYSRVIAASLSALGELVAVCSAPVADSAKQSSAEASIITPEDIEPFFRQGSQCALWLRLASKQPPLVRRAAATCLAQVLQSASTAAIACEASQIRSSVISALADEAVQPVLALLLLCRFVAAAGAASWDGLNVPKALWPQVIASLRRGLEDEGFLVKFPDLLSLLPADAWAAGRCESLLRVLLEGLDRPRALASAIWHCYFAILRVAADRDVLVSSLWRWAPVKLYLLSRVKMENGCLEVKPESNHADDISQDVASNTLPKSTLSTAACSALPPVLKVELPHLLRDAAAGVEFLESLAAWAPPVDVAGLKEGTLAQAWTNWLSLFVQYLATQSSHIDLRHKADLVLANEFQRLLSAALRAPLETLATDGVHLLKGLGAFFVPELKPDASWAPRDNLEFLHGLASEKANGMGESESNLPAPELALLSWPFLHWWRRLLFSEPSCEAALALSRHVLRPLFSSALKRDSGEQLRHSIRDMVVHGLLESPALEDPSCLARAVRLLLESLPKEMDVAASSAFRKAVKKLATRVAESVSENDLPKDDLHDRSAEAIALQLALGPGGMPASEVREVVELLVQALKQAMTDETRAKCAFRLACLIGSIFNANSDAATCLSDLRVQVISVIVKRLLSESSGSDADSSYALLPGLFRGSELSLISEALGPVPTSTATRKIWIRIANDAIRASEVHPASVFSTCRIGSASLMLDGSTTITTLRCNALASAGLLEMSGTWFLPSLMKGTDAGTIFHGLWEVLLARVACLGEIALQRASATIWSWMSHSGVDIQRDFLRFSAERAAEECQTWRLLDGTNGDKNSTTMCNSGYGLAVLGEALDKVWTSVATASSSGASELLEWALSGLSSVSGDAPNWGRAAALVFAQLRKLHVEKVNERSAMDVRNCVRAAISGAGSSQQLSAPLLHMATAVELWSSETLEAQPVQPAKTPSLGAVAHEGPVIAEVDLAAVNTNSTTTSAGETENIEELDTRLIESHERLLRWSQGSSKTIDDRDAFAAYTAAAWPSIAGTTPDMSMSSRTVTRMHRFVLELLADTQKSSVVRISPGVLTLVSALAETSSWPDSSWIAVLQAVVEVDKLMAEKLCIGQFSSDGCDNGKAGETGLPVAPAFLDAAVVAASDILQHVPDAHILSMVPFLAAAEVRLQTSAARRLRKKHWIPRYRESMAESGQSVFNQFEASVREESDGSSDKPATNTPDCSDVIYAVAVAGVGVELAKECWVVEEALASFNDWESQIENGSDDESNDQHTDGGKNVSLEAEQLPVDCQRRCIGVLSAWELVLAGLQTQQPSSASKEKNHSDNVAPLSASELVASALQLTPDQVVGAQTSQGWPSLSSPDLVQGYSPLQPLVQLLFHIITCERLAGRQGCQEVLQQVLTHAIAAGELADANDFSVFSLAARVLFLMLRAMPAAARSFWERLPRRRDRDLVERLIARVYSPGLVQAETQAAIALLDAQKDQFPDAEASVVRRQRQIVLQLARDEVNAELTVQVPESFPLRMATAEMPEKMPGIPKPRVRNWMLQSRQVLAGPNPMGVARAMLMWSRSFALFFEGVEDCPICYCLVHLTTGTIPRKACPTCKHKFHNECLYHWFKTSSKSTCPLCNQPF